MVDCRSDTSTPPPRSAEVALATAQVLYALQAFSETQVAYQFSPQVVGRLPGSLPAA